MENELTHAPARYTNTADGREAIDTMRDYCFAVAEQLSEQWWPAPRLTQIADALFITHCKLTAMKYKARRGLKGDEGGHNDRAIFFYEQMAAHVEDPEAVPDPRSQREHFQPYERQVFRLQ